MKEAWFANMYPRYFPQVSEAFSCLWDAIERETRKPVRNCDVLSKDEVLEMLKDRSFSKEDTIEWLYGKAEGENDGSK